MGLVNNSRIYILTQRLVMLLITQRLAMLLIFNINLITNVITMLNCHMNFRKISAKRLVLYLNEL